jgi:hypothetical protein
MLILFQPHQSIIVRLPVIVEIKAGLGSPAMTCALANAAGRKQAGARVETAGRETGQTGQDVGVVQREDVLLGAGGGGLEVGGEVVERLAESRIGAG